jgi:hypothetical protein
LPVDQAGIRYQPFPGRPDFFKRQITADELFADLVEHDNQPGHPDQKPILIQQFLQTITSNNDPASRDA